ENIDRFFAARLLADVELLPAERQRKILPFVLTWCLRAKKYTAVDALRAFGQIMLMREKAHAAIQPFDFLLSPTSPVTAYGAEDAAPGNDPEHALGHVCFTAQFNFSEQPASWICPGSGGKG